MGVPALFRWLSRKYPKIISPVIEEDVTLEIGAPQYSEPNPNGEIDNLYLDMNGIVHPCTHPEHKPPPETEDEMLLDVFQYTERVLMMARPRKVLMMAVDGVAPRAKMNQQRARRFRAAQDRKIEGEAREKELREREERGESIEMAIKGKKAWDTNSITPGTPFMDKLAEGLRYWVGYKLSNDPGWKDLQVIISDSSVPGEGEHKLMNFIRLQRLDPQYNPNTKHCIYGLDADLIFLGLATHEPHFRVLREDVFANQSKRLNINDQLNMTEEDKQALKEKDAKKPFLWLHINVLREYLEVELYNSKLSFPFDLERAIDDWIFMCFFVGNDFLPHLPSLDVRDNGIDILVGCWKKILSSLRGYITCDGNLNLKLVIRLMKELSSKEDEIFRKRFEQEKRREENFKRRKAWDDEERNLKKKFLPTVTKGKDKAPIQADTNMPLMSTSGEIVDGYAKLSNSDIVNNLATINKANLANASAAEKLKQLIANKNTSAVQAVKAAEALSKTDENGTQSLEEDDSEASEPVIINIPEQEKKPEPQDDVRTWEVGYHKRYYQTKFHLTSDEEISQHRQKLAYAYLEGISWVLLYYYQGCPSWQWYFPYHYAPFAQDFATVDESLLEQGIKFIQGKPFKPFEQLMSVMPADSSHTLPDGFEPLMKDSDSPIIDFYPESFEIDMNGAKMSWQGIPLLPFIDEMRLLKAVEKVYKTLTPEEIERNTLKEDVLFISRENKNYKRFVQELYEEEEDNKVVEFKHKQSGLSGKVRRIKQFEIKATSKCPLKEGDLPDLIHNEYLPLEYLMPLRSKGKSMLLNGYISHIPVLQQSDIDTIQYGNQRGGNRFRSPNDNRDYINTGPQGTKLYMIYGAREGGYRSMLEFKKNQMQSKGSYNQYNQQYNQPYNQYNQPYNQSNQYNQSYNQYNQYNQSYNQGYGQGNGQYNQGNQGYNQRFNQYNGGQENVYGNQGQNQYQGQRQFQNNRYNQGQNNQGYNQGYNRGNNQGNNREYSQNRNGYNGYR